MNLTVRTITNEVASYYNIPLDDIYCSRRKAENIKYKYIAIYFLRHFTKMSLAEIGNEFPGRSGRLNHTTVLWAIRSVSDQCDVNRIYRNEVHEIRTKLYSYIEDIREVEDEVFQQSDFFYN